MVVLFASSMVRVVSMMSFKRSLFALGKVPLPRYMIDNREVPSRPTEEDMEDFQCVFAEKEGAVTAPATASSFSPRELMKRMED